VFRLLVGSLSMRYAEESVSAAPKPVICWYLTLLSTLIVSGFVVCCVWKVTADWGATH
jgi:hypothetical protein